MGSLSPHGIHTRRDGYVTVQVPKVASMQKASSLQVRRIDSPLTAPADQHPAPHNVGYEFFQAPSNRLVI